MTVLTILVSKFLLFNVSFLIQSNVSNSVIEPEPLPTIQIRTLICPNPCRGEEFYTVIYTLDSEYTIKTSSGKVVADSIVGITPSPNHTVMLTVTDKNNISTTEEILLPTCEFDIPSAPLVSNVSICKGDPLPSLNAFVANSNLTVEWYKESSGGVKLATGLSFTPPNAGTYYALSRNTENDCISAERAAASILEIAPPCVQISARIIRN